jgi:large repetitive protein
VCNWSLASMLTSADQALIIEDRSQWEQRRRPRVADPASSRNATRAKRYLSVLALVGLLAALFSPIAALADDIANNIDVSVDTTLEVLALQLGTSPIAKQYFVIPTSGDGKNGCNLTGSTTLVVAVNSSNPTVASASPSSISFTSCGDTPSVTVTALAVGSTTITLTQISNNTGATFNFAPAAFTVTVAPPPNTPPVLTLASNITTEATSGAGAIVNFTATASDTQDGALPVSCTPTSGSAFPLGTTSVNCSATDSASATTSGSFNVTVQDTTAPSLTVPADMTEEATSPAGAVTSFTATASDIVDGTITPVCSPASGSTFGFGMTTVSCSATDAHSQATTKTFKVTVSDTTNPVVSVPSDKIVEATSSSGASVTYSATATDNIDGPLTTSCVPESGSTFPLGTTTVTCSATDIHGNTGSATFTIEVQDTTVPVVNVPASQTLEATSGAGAIATFAAATATDTVDGSLSALCNHASGETFPLGTTTVTCTATDSASNTGSASFTITVHDTTAPDTSIDSNPENPTNDASAEFNFSGSDLATDNDDLTFLCALDGEAFGDCTNPNSYSGLLDGLHTFEVKAVDEVGNEDLSSASFTWVIDTTPPTIYAGATTTGGPYTPGTWTNKDVTVDFTCDDGAGTGAPDLPSQVVSTEGADQFVTGGPCLDAAGNESGELDFVSIDIDKTVPTIAANLSTEDGTYTQGTWSKKDVTVDFTCADTLSGAADLPAQVVSTDGGDHTVTEGPCEDAAGNLSVPLTVNDIDIDKTAPSISFVSLKAGASNYTQGTWSNQSVTLEVSCSDGLSGVAAGTLSDTLTSEGADQTATAGPCVDNAGNESGTIEKNDIHIDKSAPTNTQFVGAITDGASYVFGSVPAAPTCTADGAISGLASCVVTEYATTVGPHTLTATAKDNAGNQSTKPLTYSVSAWTYKGFYQPVDMGAVNVAKAGSTIPLKFEVFAGSTELTNTSVVIGLTVKEGSDVGSLPPDVIEEYATGGTSLRYDSSSGHFIYNFSTKTLTAGKKYTVTIFLADGSKISAVIQIK